MRFRCRPIWSLVVGPTFGGPKPRKVQIMYILFYLILLHFVFFLLFEKKTTYLFRHLIVTKSSEIIALKRTELENNIMLRFTGNMPNFCSSVKIIKNILELWAT